MSVIYEIYSNDYHEVLRLLASTRMERTSPCQPGSERENFYFMFGLDGTHTTLSTPRAIRKG